MKKEIPEFLIEMSKRMNTQNNRLTADPMFEVRYKNYLITEQGYNEHHYEIWPAEFDGGRYPLFHSKSSDDYTGIAEWLFENDEEWCAAFCDYWEEDFNGMELEQFTNLLNDNFDEDEIPDSLKLLYMQEVEVTVNTHFTEADAQAFIDRKQHDYPKLYIYAMSLAFCLNMIELRNWIKGLSYEKH